jgi:RNA polymerase sigma factor (sigma-70 family)
MTTTGKPNDPSATPVAGPAFVTTRWSVVLSAGGEESPEATHALEHLCQAYWFPLYAHVRRLGNQPADAEDLTQAFFEKLLEKDWLASVDRERGRFRNFLLSSLKHFLANEWDKARAQKRGGHVTIVPLDAPAGETRLQQEPSTAAAPDREFDRRWALAVLEAVLSRLENEYRDAGKSKLFDQLKVTIGGDRSEIHYADLSRDLGMSEGSVRVAAHRLRQRYRELLRAEIAQTVATEAEVEDELRYLFAALSG